MPENFLWPIPPLDFAPKIEDHVQNWASNIIKIDKQKNSTGKKR
jgi:hypothetical protein